MQETKTRTPAEDLPPPRPAWIRVVAILGAVALLGGTLYGAWQAVASSDDGGPQAPAVPGNPNPDFSLTDDQAIDRFNHLRSTAFEATKSRDTSSVPSLFTTESPAKARLLEQIRQLRESEVLEKSSYETISQEVVANSRSEIQIRELVKFYPCFVSETGQDVTVGPRGIEQDFIWTMRTEDSEWLVHDSLLQEDRRIRDESGSCK
jgi:hypothetical protein